MLLVALRRLLQAAAPEAFAAIAAEARWRLAAATALVRRYIHVLAADISLPPVRLLARPSPTDQPPPGQRRWQERRFPLIELARLARGGGPVAAPDPPALQWALLMEAAARLCRVMADPQPHARRLARTLRRQDSAPLRDLPVPAPILRRLPPAVDILLCRLDAAARPAAWKPIEAALDTS